MIQAATALPRPKVPRCESPSVQIAGERVATFRLTGVGVCHQKPPRQHPEQIGEQRQEYRAHAHERTGADQDRPRPDAVAQYASGDVGQRQSQE